MRFISGPLCDKYGPRIPMAFILMIASVPKALTGLVKTSVGLSILYLCIGVGGSTFVMCQVRNAVCICVVLVFSQEYQSK